MASVQPPGSTFGQYEIREQIGRGGMGIVYRAHQSALGREVAVKILSMLVATPRNVKRFEYEARTAATLEHPNIVPIYDYGVHEDSTSFVVMRLLTGGSLAQRMKDSETWMPLHEIAEITLQLASALDYAHSKGVIHRDVKPANILFDDHDVPYLVDFGIVKLMHSGDSMTSTDEVVGSLAFIAPEQLRRDPLTPAADQYAMAVTVYMMLTNRLPHDADSPYVMMNTRLNDPAKPLRSYRPDLPKSLGKVMQRALEKDPAKRYPNVSAFALAFYEAAAKHGKFSRQSMLNPASIANRTLSKKTAALQPAKPVPKSDKPAAKPVTSINPRVRVVLAGVLLLFLAIVGGWAFVQYNGQNANAANQTATAEVCRVNMRSRAYIRTGPGTSYDVIRAYDRGWSTVVVGITTADDGSRWWYVEVPSLNANYWVSDSVTEEIGDCSSVPQIAG